MCMISQIGYLVGKRDSFLYFFGISLNVYNVLFSEQNKRWEKSYFKGCAKKWLQK